MSGDGGGREGHGRGRSGDPEPDGPPRSGEPAPPQRGPLTGGRVTRGFWALFGAIAGLVVGGAVLARQLASELPSEQTPWRPLWVVAALAGLAAWGAGMGLLLHRYRDPVVGARGVARVILGLLGGFAASAGLHALGLVPRAAVPLLGVVGGAIGLALAYRDRA